jgi:23S rRNA (uracil1939-C5)-methyltransferase
MDEPMADADAVDGCVRVTALSHGPHAVARQNGKVVFVRGAAPGDEVRIAVREEHRSYVYADVIQVLRASPDRRVAPCPYLPRCGGCPWQHLTYAAQLRAKEAVVREHVTRALRGTQNEGSPTYAPIVAAAPEFGYRHRLSLRVAATRRPSDRQVGFFAGGSHELVPVEHCLLAESALDGAIPLAAQWVARLRSEPRRLELLLAADGVRWVFLVEVEGGLAVGDGAVATEFLSRHPGVAALGLRGRRARRVWGDDRCALDVEPGLRLVVRAGTFSQVTRTGNQALLRAVLAAGAFAAAHHVLDLFAGAGNLSLPIARRAARVVAIERDARAVEDGRANAQALGITRCEFRRASSLAGVRDVMRRGERYDVAVLDPPRSGAADLVPALLDLAPARIVYASCDPATLARDLRLLGSRYRVDHVQPIDLFPQTYHVETVVGATLAC